MRVAVRVIVTVRVRVSVLGSGKVYGLDWGLE